MKEIHNSTKQQRVGRYLQRTDPTLFEELLVKASTVLDTKDPVKEAKRLERHERRVRKMQLTGKTAAQVVAQLREHAE